MATAGAFLDDVIGSVKGVGTVLNSNKAINSLGKNMGGAFEAGGRMIKDGNGFGEAMARTFTNNADDLYKNGKRVKGAKAELNYGKIAGSYIGASAAMRVVSGGGVYKDQNGNSNLIGLPFV